MSEQLGQWRVTYTPGAWLVLSGPTSLVVLQPASGQWSELINSIWDAVVTAGSVNDLASRLAGFGLDEMPSFASFFWAADGMHSLIRGAIRVIDLATDRVVGDGVGVQTWSEVGLAGVERIRVDMEPYGGPQPPLELPLIVGAVTASSIVLDSSEAARVFGPQSAPVTDQQPAAEAEMTVPVHDPQVPPLPTGVGGSVPLTDSGAGQDTEVFFPDPAQQGPGGDSGPLVFAVRCPLGHANPPEAQTCRLCYSPIAPQNVQQIPRPVLAVLLPSTSGPVEVDRPVLIGRSPSTSRTDADQLPWLLTVPSPSHDISRTHLEIAPDGWKLRATDLNSTNGTILIRPNAAPERMPPGQPVEVTPGCVLDLGDGVTVAIDNPQA